jgi:polyhydroxybutyrate depolymerase
MRNYIVLICILFHTAICLSQKTISRVLMYDGIPRNYKVYQPAAYTGQSPWPVVFSLHGYTMTIDEQINVTDMNSVADTGNFLVVYPQGLIIPSQWSLEGLPGTAPGWNYGGLSETDDFGFLNSLMNTIENSFNVDRTRIYLVGFSNGAQMSYALTCRFPERIAAIAGVVGKMVDTIFAQCTNAQAKPVLTIHGTIDPCVDYYEYPSALETVKFWRQLASCDTTAVMTSLPDVYPADNSTLTEFKCAECAEDIEILHLRINDGGHIWPGRFCPEINGRENFDIDGSSYIWSFLRKYSLATTDMRPLSGKSGHINIYPNPFTEYLTVDLPEKQYIYKIDIIDLCGRTIRSINNIPTQTVTIYKENLVNGIYFLKIYSDGIFVKKVMVQ